MRREIAVNFGERAAFKFMLLITRVGLAMISIGSSGKVMMGLCPRISLRD
jgi:hypothetical protein